MKIRIILFQIILLVAFTCVSSLANAQLFESLSNHTDGNYSSFKTKKTSKNKPADKLDAEKQSEIQENSQNKFQEKTVKNLEENKREQEKHKHIEFSQFGIGFMPSTLSVHGVQTMNNTKGTINSKTFPALRVGYQYIYDQWRLSLFVGHKKIEIENSDERMIMNPKQTLLLVDMQIARSFGRFGIGLGAGKEGRIFYKAMNSGVINVERRSEERFWILTDFDLFNSEKNNIKAIFRLGYNPAAKTETYDIEPGHFYSGILKYDHLIAPGKRIGLEVLYKDNVYRTEQLRLESTEMGIGLAFSFDIGAGK